MLMVLDAGNSRLKAALARGDRLGPVHRLPSTEAADQDALDRLLDSLLLTGADDGTPREAPEAMVLASVVPGVTEAVRRSARRRRLTLVEASPSTLPIEVRVPHPAGVGSDRLVNAFAASRLHGCPVIVIAMGTATTIDAVGRDGAYLGGAIAPGLGLGLEALATRTAQLPLLEPRPPERALGRDTAEAMRSGAFLGHVGAVRELRTRILAELAAEGEGARTVLTGGLGTPAFAAALGGVDVLDPELTLRGLTLLRAPVVAGR